MATAAARSEQASGAYRWYALALLFAVALVNYLDRFVFAVIVEQVKREFGTSDFALGLLSGAAFALFYATLGIPIARWADGGNRRHIIAGALALWSAATALCGLAATFPLLVLARIGVGVGEAGSTPPSHSLISDLFAPAERARALAIVTFGGTVGSLLAFALGAQLAAAYGWRATLIALGLPGVLLALLVGLTLREPRAETIGPAAGLAGLGRATRRLFARPVYPWLCAGFALWGFATYGLTQWFVPYLLRVRNLGLVEASGQAGLVSAIAPALGTLLGGWLADRLARTSAAWLARLPALCCLGALPLYLAAGLVEGVGSMILLVAAAGFLIGLMVPAGYAALHWVAGGADRAMGVAVAFFFLNFVGYGGGPAVIGLASDLLLPSLGARSIATALALGLSVLLPASICFWRAARHLNLQGEPA